MTHTIEVIYAINGTTFTRQWEGLTSGIQLVAPGPDGAIGKVLIETDEAQVSALYANAYVIIRTKPLTEPKGTDHETERVDDGTEM